MSSSLRTSRGGKCAAAATFRKVKCLFTRRKGDLIDLGLDLEVLKKSMTNVSCLTDYKWIAAPEPEDSPAGSEKGSKTMTTFRLVLISEGNRINYSMHFVWR